MNAREMYLAWVRTNHPDIYVTALQQFANGTVGMSGIGDDSADVFGRPIPSVLRGLGDDTTGTDLTTVDTSQLPDVVMPTLDIPTVTAAPASSSASSGNIFSSITNAITSVSNAVTTTEAQQNLLAINTQRARQGLPPLSMNGQVVTAGQLAPASSAVLQAEQVLAGSGGMGMLLLIGLGLLLLMRR